MGELKQHQPPMTIDEQVENLKNIGLIVEDEEYAKRILNDVLRSFHREKVFLIARIATPSIDSLPGCYQQ